MTFNPTNNNDKFGKVVSSDPGYQKKLDAEDIILDNIADDMTESNVKIFRKHLFSNRGVVDILLPQIAKILAMSNMLFIDAVLRGAGPSPDPANEYEFGPTTIPDARIDIINMTSDILRVLIEEKHTETYIPVHLKHQARNKKKKTTTVA